MFQANGRMRNVANRNSFTATLLCKKLEHYNDHVFA